jgi:hypothetical protein
MRTIANNHIIVPSAKICAKYPRKSAGKLSCALKLFKVLKHFPQIFADFSADERRYF